MKYFLCLFVLSMLTVSLLLKNSVVNLNQDRETAKAGMPAILDSRAENNTSIEKTEAGIQYEVNYFKHWHYPYGSIIPPEILKEKWADIEKIPEENDVSENTVNSWISYGPFGISMKSIPNIRFSGRILDLERTQGSSIRVAAASGGLWGYSGVFPTPLSDKLDNSIAIGSFVSKAGDPNTIIVGTGEPYLRTGQGIFLTSNGGTSWISCNFDIGFPDGVFKVRYHPNDSGIIAAATTSGLYISRDGGLLFNRKLPGSCSDLFINPGSPNQIWTAVWGAGLYYSSDNGDTWSPMLTFPDFGRASISAGAGNYLYVSIARNSNSSMLGVYRSSNNGINWTAINPLNDIFFNGAYQGWFDNVISASPLHNGLVLLGGIYLWRSTNYGVTWNQVPSPNIHPDQHSIVWSNQNDSVLVGNDGGLTISSDAGLTWSNITNRFPITQYVDIGLSGNYSNPFTGEIFGGSQDNGFSGTTNFGNIWYYTGEGDGGGICIDPNNASMLWGTLGVFADVLFSRHRSTDFGQTWTVINNGLEHSEQWFTKIRNDQIGDVNLYSNSDNYVYYSTNKGDLWQKLNQTPFPASVSNVNVSVYSSPSAVVYACLNDTSPGSILRVYDNNTWFERSSGFPPHTMVRGVAQHPTNNNIAYALMNGLSSAEKIYKTTNRGINWVNITGDLPNIPMGDLIPHPDDPNKLYLGTEMGCYKTTDGGINWIRWNNGMPPAAIVTEMCYADSTSVNGKFYVVAGTYGRGVYIRDISGDDPIGIKKISKGIPSNYLLKQNYPNPFNPSTRIQFSLPVRDFVELQVYNILGRKVADVINQEMTAGSHNINFDASKLSSGIYFYRLHTPRFSDTKKMVVIK